MNISNFQIKIKGKIPVLSHSGSGLPVLNAFFERKRPDPRSCGMNLRSWDISNGLPSIFFLTFKQNHSMLKKLISGHLTRRGTAPREK
jgi:hypothetical protein